MSIEQPDVIDVVADNPEANRILLVISDHLDWSQELDHLIKLQDKLNTYLRFVEGGELAERFSSFVDPEVLIEVIGKYEQPETTRRFMTEAAKIIAGAGCSLSFRKLS